MLASTPGSSIKNVEPISYIWTLQSVTHVLSRSREFCGAGAVPPRAVRAIHREGKHTHRDSRSMESRRTTGLTGVDASLPAARGARGWDLLQRLLSPAPTLEAAGSNITENAQRPLKKKGRRALVYSGVNLGVASIARGAPFSPSIFFLDAGQVSGGYSNAA